MSRPNFCPECGSPLKDDLVHPFSVGPKDYADGGYHVICRADDGALCWLGNVYDSDEQKGRYTEEEKEAVFGPAVAAARENGRYEHLLDTMAEYQLEAEYRIEAHLKAMDDDELIAFMKVCDDHSQNCHGFESFSEKVKQKARGIQGLRLVFKKFQEQGSPLPYCLYHACKFDDCAHLHGDDNAEPGSGTGTGTDGSN